MNFVPVLSSCTHSSDDEICRVYLKPEVCMRVGVWGVARNDVSETENASCIHIVASRKAQRRYIIMVGTPGMVRNAMVGTQT